MAFLQLSLFLPYTLLLSRLFVEIPAVSGITSEGAGRIETFLPKRCQIEFSRPSIQARTTPLQLANTRSPAGVTV